MSDDSSRTGGGMAPLSIEGLATPAAGEHGAVPKLQWVAIADLVVDKTYQREMTPHSRKRVEAIAEAFDWSLFSPVVAAPAVGGKYALIDGQHRSTAALLVGETHVPAMIVIADRSRQAKSFAAINGSVTKMSSMAVFKAAVAAGDPASVRCVEIARAAGVRILTYPLAAKRQQEGDTMAAASLMRALSDHGETPLGLALTAIMASKGDRRGLVDSANVRALTRFFRTHPMGAETIRKVFAFIALRAVRAEAVREGYESLEMDTMRAVEKRLVVLAKGLPGAAASSPARLPRGETGGGAVA